MTIIIRKNTPIPVFPTVELPKRVKDPELRRMYCERDGAHEYEYAGDEVDSTTGTSHIYYYEYAVYRCRYCGRSYREETGSWHD